MERELFPLCEHDRIGVIPYNPLAGGLLTGQHERSTPRAGSRFALESEQGERYRERYWRDEFHDTVEQIKPIAENEGISMAQLAVAWVLSKPFVTSPIVGATNPTQLDDAIAAVSKPLSEEAITQLNELTHKYRAGDDER
jgi:aryl-alcohol dehydrogenase (NADP+)